MCEGFALSEKEFEPLHLYIYPIQAPGRWLELLNLAFKILISALFLYNTKHAIRFRPVKTLFL